MKEDPGVVPQMTNVVPQMTSAGRPAAEWDRLSAWWHLMTTPVRKDEKWLGRPAGMPSIHDTSRQLTDIAQKYDRVVRGLDEPGAVEGIGETDLLAALLVIRELREKLQSDEVRLLGAARSKNVTWARIAQALGLKSRQAAERRHLQLRSDLDEAKGAPLKQAERVTYARSLRDKPEEGGRLDRRTTRVAQLAGRLAALPDLAQRAADPWPDRLAEALAGLATLASGGGTQGTSGFPERYAATWRTKYTQQLSELLGQARDANRVDLSGHPRLLADIEEFCAAAGIADPS
ncbi:hypothetical protein ACFCZ1_00515 [Streptomyces sp. NPDC056224]|uniref:hypothetical protein n=1 Tax=Streptomyces sp. NPDC056224 TaxID=3345750 RepID=UPI0035DC7599